MNPQALDFHWEQLINGPAGHTPVVDQLMVAAASWSEEAFVAVVVIWFLVGMFLVSRREKQGAIAALLGAGGALLVNFVLSRLYYHPRPFIAHPHQVHELVAHANDNSFPSDHAAGAFGVAIVLFAYHRRLGAVGLVCAAWVAYARVYVGDHYPLDVIVGTLVGLVVGSLFLTWLAFIPSGLARLADWILGGLRLQPRQ